MHIARNHQNEISFSLLFLIQFETNQHEVKKWWENHQSENQLLTDKQTNETLMNSLYIDEVKMFIERFLHENLIKFWFSIRKAAHFSWTIGEWNDF